MILTILWHLFRCLRFSPIYVCNRHSTSYKLYLPDNSSQFDVKNFNSGGGGNGSDFFKSVSWKNRIDDFDGPFSNALTKPLHWTPEFFKFVRILGGLRVYHFNVANLFWYFCLKTKTNTWIILLISKNFIFSNSNFI